MTHTNSNSILRASSNMRRVNINRIVILAWTVSLFLIGWQISINTVHWLWLCFQSELKLSILTRKRKHNPRIVSPCQQKFSVNCFRLGFGNWFSKCIRITCCALCLEGHCVFCLRNKQQSGCFIFPITAQLLRNLHHWFQLSDTN